MMAEGPTHAIYLSPDRHNGGSNYAFADGHAKWMKFDQTLQSRYWGNRFYSLVGSPPVY
jgi:prepilin-type processing-associated H-X9-DG protein